jgi:hypothetical protein
MSAPDRRSRAALTFAAFAAFAGAYVTTPITARSAADAPPVIAPLPTPTPRASPYAVVLPRRDPFAGAPDTTAARPARSDDARLSTQFPLATWPHGLAPLPPNAGATAMSPLYATPGARPLSAAARSLSAAAQPLAARVTALVTGPHPYALVDDGGTTRLVTLGDRIGDTMVAAISASGVRLADGRRLPLVTAPGPVPSAPSAPPAPRAQTPPTAPKGP